MTDDDTPRYPRLVPITLHSPDGRERLVHVSLMTAMGMCWHRSHEVALMRLKAVQMLAVADMIDPVPRKLR